MPALDQCMIGLPVAAAGIAGEGSSGRAIATGPRPEIRTIRMSKSQVVSFASLPVTEAIWKAKWFGGAEHIKSNFCCAAAAIVVDRTIDISVPSNCMFVQNLDSGFVSEANHVLETSMSISHKFNPDYESGDARCYYPMILYGAGVVKDNPTRLSPAATNSGSCRN